MPLSTGTAGAHDDSMHQGSAKRDTNGGVAALYSDGTLLSKGSVVAIPRDGSNIIYLQERTSGEKIAQFTRNAANDYLGYIKESNVAQRIQTASMKDAASGIMGLDANILSNPAENYPVLEEYLNHLGAVDNFTQTGTAGNGTAAADATNHEMDLSTGVNLAGSARFESKKTWTLGTKPIVINMRVTSLGAGTGGSPWAFAGMRADFSVATDVNIVAFRQTTNGSWYTATADGGAVTANAITALANGDLVTIVATSSSVRFFVNGTLVQTHTTNIPIVGLKLGANVAALDANTTVARTLSVDMMSIKAYL